MTQTSNKQEHLELHGKITAVNPSANFIVTTDEGLEVKARISGKMRKFRIRLTLHDEVTVKVSQYDLSNGIITYRH